jgi:integrase
VSQSTRAARRCKPAKPRPDFPLFPHQTRRWAKKIRGKMHYFGPWEDPGGSLAKYLDQKDDLHAGRTPRVQSDGLMVRDLVNRFLTGKRNLLDSGEITARSFKDYHATCERIVGVFGKTRVVEDLAADDFERLRAELAKRMGPGPLGNEIQRVRVVFKYGYDAGLIAKPVRYGPGFKKPSRKVLRLARAARGPRMFEAAELRSMLDAAGVPLRALLLLGVNCGLGNTDLARMPLSALDLDRGWLDYPRPKTGVGRRCPLWPETVQAVRDALAVRPAPKDGADAGLAFLTLRGLPWVRVQTSEAAEEGKGPPVEVRFDDSVSKETAKLLKALGLSRLWLNFYALRHTFETVGGESRDQVAVDHVMGHARDDMASVYREKVSDERIKAVCEHVRAWLFPRRKATQNKSARVQ